nr:MAG TPA: hypothetical protein [Caudoviricetes sp.]
MVSRTFRFTHLGLFVSFFRHISFSRLYTKLFFFFFN